MTVSPATLAVRPHAPAVLVLDLTEPLPGFPAYRDYALVPADGSGLLSWLQAVAPDGPRFLVVATAVFFPEYAPAFPPAAQVELGLASAGAARMYAVLTVPAGDVTAATANLRAPLVVNPTTCRARQIVLSDPTHPVRRPLRR